MRRVVVSALIVVAICAFCLQRAPSSDSTGDQFEALVPTADIEDGVTAEGTILVVIGKPGASFLDGVSLGRCFEDIGEIAIVNSVAIDPDGGGADRSQIGFGAGEGFAAPRPGTRYMVVAVSSETCGEEIPSAGVVFHLTKVTLIEI